MRCGIYGEKTQKKIQFPAILQIKADGMFQAVTVVQGEVTFTSRSGEERNFTHLKPGFEKMPDGVYIGELLVKGVTNRAESNGIINSDDDQEDVFIQLWDYVTLDEYSRGKDKTNKTHYNKRFDTLNSIVCSENSHISIIPSISVSCIQDALKQTSEWMNDGLEGAILKDFRNIFIDHTSPTQLKLKIKIDAEMRVTGFIEGKIGTKRENTFGSLVYTNDEGTIKGSCSGFDDKQLNEINNNRDKYIGKIITIQFNDITKGRNNTWYALSHPRFIEVRDDKNETDTLEKVKK